MLDHTIGIHFLADRSAQITIIPATKKDKKRGSHIFTLQVVNKSLIQIYGQRCLTLNLGLKRVFTHIFVIADMEKAILGADCFTNMAFSWIITSVVWRTLWQTCGLLVRCVKNSLIQAFTSFFKKMLIYTKPSVHKEILPHSMTHHLTTTGLPADPVYLPRKNQALWKPNLHKWRKWALSVNQKATGHPLYTWYPKVVARGALVAIIEHLTLPLNLTITPFPIFMI